MCKVLGYEWKTELQVPRYALKRHISKSPILTSATQYEQSIERKLVHERATLSFKMLGVLKILELMGK